jgi:hypothetical protein
VPAPCSPVDDATRLRARGLAVGGIPLSASSGSQQWCHPVRGSFPCSSGVRPAFNHPLPLPTVSPLAEATRAHRWIIGYVCHELRNPLHVLKAAIATLLERPPPPPPLPRVCLRPRWAL